MRRVSYVHSPALMRAADLLPSNLGRASVAHKLIKELDLLDYASDRSGATASTSKATVLESVAATRDDLLRFHDAAFVDALLGIPKEPTTDSDDDGTPPPAPNFHLRPSFARTAESGSPRKRQKMIESHGLEDDCPLFEGLDSHVLEVAGASLTAARELRDGKAEVAIAWTGGRHHGKRGEAAGYCYVQDVALAIIELRRPPPKTRIPSPESADGADEAPRLPAPAPPPRISRVLYVDIDLHHGDGVELAFASSPYVLTLSLHLHAALFFPSTGALSSTGPPAPSAAAFHALNLALHPGLSDKNLVRVFESCVEKVYQTYRPDAVVVQCGCDGLQGDPCGEWNLGLAGMAEVVRRIVGWGKRTLLLGGGGYDNANAARCWAHLTSVALGRPLDLRSDVPLDLSCYDEFGPSFTLDVPQGNRIDQNTESRLQEVEQAFAGYVEELEKKYGSKGERS